MYKIYKYVFTAEIIAFEIRCVITVNCYKMYLLLSCIVFQLSSNSNCDRVLKIICYTLLVSKMHEMSSIVFFFFSDCRCRGSRIIVHLSPCYFITDLSSKNLKYFFCFNEARICTLFYF